MISSERENIISVIEDHLLESISSTSWNDGDEESDFTYITERYNQFQRNIDEWDKKNIGILFGILKHDDLTVSVIGNTSATLREKNGDLSIIAENTETGEEFTSVSSGKIPSGSQIFLTSRPLSRFMADDCLDECALLSHEIFMTTMEGILERDTRESIHLIRIKNESKIDDSLRKKIKNPSAKKIIHQADIMRSYVWDMWSGLFGREIYSKYREHVRVFLQRKNTTILILFLIIGIILFFLLISTLIWALFSIQSSPQIDVKNQIIEAQTLIEESQKLTSNSAAFNANIKAAEDILFQIRDRQEYMKDTQELLLRIEAMKKEMYDIQTIDITKRESIIPFNPLDISPIQVFESNKKLNLIGKTSALLGYIPSSTLPQVISYPPGEEVLHADSTDDGNVYFLTKNKRILSTKRNEITYANVTGQNGWEDAGKIRTFNNNLYLIDQNIGQIYRHKPGVNGFSQKSEVLPVTLSGILDVGIDGGFYIVTDEPRIYRLISKEWENPTGLILNKIPWEFNLDIAEKTQIIVRPNLSYIYLLSGDRVWIFQPDSRRFQDVRSWTYVAQLEISTDEELRSISVPRDGLVYIVTNLGVYNLEFELIDNNIILKN
jgi:hypothetical protein